MAFLSNLLNMFTNTSDIPEDKIIDVPTKQYKKIPVCLRHDCLILYGPRENIYELLLLQPLSISQTTAFSLFRLKDKENALEKFGVLQSSLLPIIKLNEAKIMYKAVLIQICETLKANPSYSAAHVIIELGFSWAIDTDLFQGLMNEQDWKYGRTPLHIAIQNENNVLIEHLISKCRTDIKDFFNNSIYHYAAVTSPAILKIINEKTNAGLNDLNKAGKSPLHLACKEDKPKCVKELLTLGADANTASTVDSILPLHEALKADSTLCVREIIKMFPNQLSSTDMKYGGTPLHWCDSKKMIKALCELGCKVDARNFQRASALHKMVENNRMECVMCLLALDATVNIQDSNGNTPLHLASNDLILKTLLVFNADLNVLNNKGESPRHIVSTSDYSVKHHMLLYLHKLGAQRCRLLSSTCNEGCSPKGCFDGVPPDSKVVRRLRSSFDELMDQSLSAIESESMQRKLGRVLCLDGGGIKGLVLIQMLKLFEYVSKVPTAHLFDWIGGTSTGGIIALAISFGYTLEKCQNMYFRMKDEIFVGMRPYNEKPLEEALKRELGSETVMSDINGRVKVMVTAVAIDRNPADLHFFRNYISSEEMYEANGMCPDNCHEIARSVSPPDQLVWKAARASCAAPTYFDPFENYVDGGIISNNPTLDVLTEIAEYNTMLKLTGNARKIYPANIVVSLGVGKPPVQATAVSRMNEQHRIFKSIKRALELPKTLKLLIDQVTMSDNRTVDRARAWCGQCDIKYLRLSPQLSQEVELDETRDDIVINMLFEALVYSYENLDKITDFVNLLKNASKN